MTDHAAARAAIREMRLGRPIVVTDHPGRENEGDLVMAADCATPKHVAFMMEQCRGLICAPMSTGRATALRLPPMVADNAEAHRTAFTVSVDAAAGITTGISATDRARTLRVLSDPASHADDLVRPGHMFPLIAANGGVLERAGHTEAAVDLAVASGHAPVGVICEIAGADGEMLSGEDLRAFSRRHGLAQISIEDLVAYRRSDRRGAVRVG